MGKILIILGAYYPVASANGVCIKSVVGELKRENFEVSILATNEGNLASHEETEGTNVYRIKARCIERILNWCNNCSHKALGRVVERFARIMNRVQNVIFYPTWPLVAPYQAYRYFSRAKKLHKKNGYDLVLAVYNPINALIAGVLLKNKYSEIQLALYFLDAISIGIVPRGLTAKWLKKRGYRWEKYLFNASDAIFIMKSHEKFYFESRYARFHSKIRVVDIPLVKEITFSPNAQEVDFDENKVNIVYTGTLRKGIRDPSYLLHIFANIDNNLWKLHIFGGGDCDDLIYAYMRANRGVSLAMYGRVDTETALSAITKADVLVNVGNSVQTLTPSKIFEYMSVGKPIINFYRLDSDTANLYLKRYSLSLPIKEDYVKLRENVKRIENFVNEHADNRVPFAEVSAIFKDNTAKPVVRHIIKNLRWATGTDDSSCTL